MTELLAVQSIVPLFAAMYSEVSQSFVGDHSASQAYSWVNVIGRRRHDG